MDRCSVFGPWITLYINHYVLLLLTVLLGLTIYQQYIAGDGTIFS